MSVKITSLELENVKRVKAVALTPDPNGLTVIGGKNGQGKTSVLDAIAWALGGDRYRPSSPEREGSVIPPRLHVELSNGIVVERKGKNGALTVLDPSGKRAGQQLLNEFISALPSTCQSSWPAAARKRPKPSYRFSASGRSLPGWISRNRSFTSPAGRPASSMTAKRNMRLNSPFTRTRRRRWFRSAT